MRPYQAKVEDLVQANTDFRRVIFTTEKTQLVLMTLQAGEEIGDEVHTVDQVLHFEEGVAKAVLDGVESQVEAGSIVVVPAGTRHNFINVGSGLLKLYTLYAPPQHKDGTVHHTKAEADKAEAEEHQ